MSEPVGTSESLPIESQRDKANRSHVCARNSRIIETRIGGKVAIIANGSSVTSRGVLFFVTEQISINQAKTYCSL